MFEGLRLLQTKEHKRLSPQFIILGHRSIKKHHEPLPPSVVPIGENLGSGPWTKCRHLDPCRRYCRPTAISMCGYILCRILWFRQQKSDLILIAFQIVSVVNRLLPRRLPSKCCGEKHINLFYIGHSNSTNNPFHQILSCVYSVRFLIKLFDTTVNVAVDIVRWTFCHWSSSSNTHLLI